MKPSPTAPALWGRDLLLLGLVFGALYFFLLGRAPLANPDEGRYAEIPREMVATGDWVTPRLDGVNYFEKPPLVYWAVALELKLFGPGEGGVRAVPALAGLAGVLLAYAAGRRLWGRNAGLGAAGVLGTSALYMAFSHILLLDLAVAVLMSAALFCFLLGVREPPGAGRRALFYGLYASAALATLTKGLIGFLVTGAVMFLWLVLLGQWKRLRPFYLPTGALLFLAIAAPWHLLANARNPGWAHFYFVYEQWERFQTTTGHDRFGPWWYFIPVVLLGLFPWVGFLWPAGRDALRGGWARRRENAEAWFLVIWAGFIFLFFSKSHSKLIPYILPVFPPLAVLIGAWLARQMESNSPAPLRGGLRLFAGVCGFLTVGIWVVLFWPGLIHNLDPQQASALKPIAALMTAVLALGGLTTLRLARRPGPALASVVGTMALFFAVLVLAAPELQKPGTKELALQVRQLARPGERVFHYHEFFHDFTFYARRTVDLVAFHGELEPDNDDPARIPGRFIGEADFRLAWSGPARVFAVARKRDIAQLFADPSFRYHLLGESRDHYLFSNQD